MRNRAAIFAAFVALLVSLGGAVAFLATNNWFGAGDLSAMVFWTVPFAVVIYLSFRPVSVRLAQASTARRYAILVLLGGMIGLGWTALAALLLGPWIMAFSFPVLLCWLGGGLAAGMAAAWLAQPATWRTAVSGAAVLFAALLRMNAYAIEPEPRVRVVLAPGTTQADEERFWREVIGEAGRTPTEHSLLDGIESAGIAGYEAGRPVFGVTFRKGLSRERRDSLVARIRRSGIVARVYTVVE